MSGRSYSYVAIHVCHQQMALKQVNWNIRISAFHWPISVQYLCTYVCFVMRIMYRDISGLHQQSLRHLAFKTFSVLTNSRVLLVQSHDYSCYVSRRILAPPPLWLHKRPDLGTIKPNPTTCDSLDNVTFIWTFSTRGINPATPNCTHTRVRKNSRLNVRKHTAAVPTGRMRDSTT
jgi:hypothetical protein